MIRFEFTIVKLDMTEHVAVISADNFPYYLDEMNRAFDNGEILAWTYDVLI